MPMLTRYLLLASFIASYNSVKTDRRFFGHLSTKKKEKNTPALPHGKSSSRRRTPFGSDLSNSAASNTGTRHAVKFKQLVLGPKPFHLERMLAIFWTLVPEPIDCGLDLFLQVGRDRQLIPRFSSSLFF